MHARSRIATGRFGRGSSHSQRLSSGFQQLRKGLSESGPARSWTRYSGGATRRWPCLSQWNVLRGSNRFRGRRTAAFFESAFHTGWRFDGQGFGGTNACLQTNCSPALAGRRGAGSTRQPDAVSQPVPAGQRHSLQTISCWHVGCQEGIPPNTAWRTQYERKWSGSSRIRSHP